MWLLINLSKEYTTKVTYYVIFKKLPQDKILQETPESKMEFLVKGNGFKLLSANFSNKKLSFLIDKLKNKSESDFYLLTENKKREIQNQLRSGLELIEIVKDTINFKIGTLKTKKIAVIPDVNLNYKIGFGLEEIIMEPDSILISGPELQIDKIQSIKTEKIEFQEISEDIVTQLKLELSDEAREIKTSHSLIAVNVKVDKFTEGSFEIPIEIVNAPKEVAFNTFPKKVKITYRVGLKNYNKITANLFKVVCDYNKTREANLEYLVPKLQNSPELISSVRITPQKIDFLIHK